MPFTTSNPLKAWFCGEILVACVLGFLWAVDLPLNAWFCVVWLGVGGIAAGVYFYEMKPAKHGRASKTILMPHVSWDFAEPPAADLEAFVAAVARQQSVETSWSPDALVGVRGPLEVHFATYHDDQSSEKAISLTPKGSADWTQAEMLFALHQKLGGDPSLGDATFFEGLIPCGKRQYRLWLGS